MKIEKNIPLPGETRGRPPSGKYGWISEFEPGDSVLVQQEKDYHLTRYALHHYNIKYRSCKTDEGWRIWRVE
jgi:hypothetical protein